MKFWLNVFTLAGSGSMSTLFIYLIEINPEEGYKLTHALVNTSAGDSLHPRCLADSELSRPVCDGGAAGGA